MINFSTLRRSVLVTALLSATTLTFAQSPIKLILGHGAAPGALMRFRQRPPDEARGDERRRGQPHHRR